MSQGSWERGRPRGRAVKKGMAGELLPGKRDIGKEQREGEKSQEGCEKGHQWAERWVSC